MGTLSAVREDSSIQGLNGQGMREQASNGGFSGTLACSSTSDSFGPTNLPNTEWDSWVSNSGSEHAADNETPRESVVSSPRASAALPPANAFADTARLAGC